MKLSKNNTHRNISRLFYQKDILLILIASFFYFSSPMLATPLITGFTGSLGANAALMGIVGGLMNLCSLLCRPFVGNLADRISKYRLSCIGAFLMLAASLGYTVAQRPLVVVLSRIINGAGFACCSVCMSTWLSNLLPRDKIGSGMGIYGAMNALAMGIAPSAGVYIYQNFSYRTAFGLTAVFSALILIVIQFIEDHGEPIHTSITPQSSALQTKKENLQLVDKKVLPIAIIITLFAIPYCATQSFLVTYAQVRNINISVGLFFPTYAAALFLLRFTLKGLFDKLPFKVFLLAGCICAAASLFSLAAMENNLIMFLAGIFMAGGYGIMCSVCQSTAILLAGPEKRGIANSTYYIGLDLGMTLGPFIGGILVEHLEIHLFYPVLLITVPLILMVYFLSKGTIAEIKA